MPELRDNQTTPAEKPIIWAEWKKSHSRWKWLYSVEWALEWLLYWLKGLAVFGILEIAGRLSVAVALVVWLLEAGDRTKQKHYRAWELINSARRAGGDGGRRDALEDLANDGVSLAGAFLAGANLPNIRLPKANLSNANLSGSNLSESNLSKALLTDANMSDATLVGANLSGALLSLLRVPLGPGETENPPLFFRNYVANLPRANLFRANLSGVQMPEVNLSEADLSYANLSNADLSGVNLSHANLFDANLQGANMNGAKFCRTKMPDGKQNDADCPVQEDSR